MKETSRRQTGALTGDREGCRLRNEGSRSLGWRPGRMQDRNEGSRRLGGSFGRMLAGEGQ